MDEDREVQADLHRGTSADPGSAKGYEAFGASPAAGTRTSQDARVSSSPDYCEPILGWRAWHAVERHDDVYLVSLFHRVRWPWLEPLVGSCHTWCPLWRRKRYPTHNWLLPVNIVLPALTSLLSFGFALVLVARFSRRHQPYYLVWTLGLLWYALAAGSEAVGALSAWTPVLYKLWYTTGAIGVAAYLGAGTIYLHKDQPFGSLTVVCFLIGSIPALAGRPGY